MSKDIKEIIGEALRAIGSQQANRKGWLAKLADELGVSERQVENWYYGEHAPQADALIALFAYFGAEFTSEILKPTGLRAVPRGLTRVASPAQDLANDIRAVIEKHTTEAG